MPAEFFAPPVLMLAQPVLEQSVGRHDDAGLAGDRSIDHAVEQTEILITLEQGIEIECAVTFEAFDADRADDGAHLFLESGFGLFVEIENGGIVAGLGFLLCRIHRLDLGDRGIAGRDIGALGRCRRCDG